MPTDIIYSDDGATITYFSKAHPEIAHRVSRDKVISAAFTARDWHGGQWTGMYALQCGTFDYATIERAFSEGCSALAKEGSGDDADAYYALEAMTEDLRACLDPRFGEGAKCVQGCGRDAAEARLRCEVCAQ